MKLKNCIGICLITSLLILSGWVHFKPSSSLAKLDLTGPFFARETAGVFITSRTYNHDDSTRFLKRDLLSEGYQPVQFTMQNNTSHSYVVSDKSIALPQATASDVAWKITKRKIPQAIGLKILSFFFWPFMIPSMIDSIITFKAHRDLVNDLEVKSIRTDEQALVPYSTLHRVIFVKSEEFAHPPVLTLMEGSSKKPTDFPVVETN